LDDFEDLPVETVAGDRSAGAVADRLLIGLAAAALLGGLLIAAANLLSGFLPETAAGPSQPAEPPSSQPAATARPTSTERPAREILVIPGEPPEMEDPYLGFSTAYWVEALEPLPIHALPGSNDVMGRIRSGEVILAEDQPWEEGAEAWLYAYGARTPGWIPIAGRDGRPLARLHLADNQVYPGWVGSLAAGPTGFVLHGMGPTIGARREEPVAMVSADGERWSPVGVPMTPWGGWVAAWGPSGYLAMSAVTGPQGLVSTWLWESASGTDWSPVGELDFPTNESVLQLAGSEQGYLLAVASSDDGSANLWFSPDGLVWQESRGSIVDLADTTLQTYGPHALRIAASPAGFVSWVSTGAEQRGIVATYSSDGRRWAPIQLTSGAGAMSLTFALTGDRVLGLGSDDEGRWRAFAGSQAGAISLEPAPHLEVAFEGAAVWSLVSDGQTAYAFGTDRNNGSDLAWAGDGSGWRRIATPEDGFGAPVGVVAAGPAGVVAVGGEPNGVLTEPILWHLRTDGRWARQASSVIPPIPRPTSDDCGDLPDTAVEFMGLAPAIAVPCFGSRPMSFTAWSIECDGCFIGGHGPRGAAGWLLNPRRTFQLVPIQDENSETGYAREAIAAPELEWRDAFAGTWLEVTGHYDDPASGDCRRLPSPTDESYFPGPQVLVNVCRQRFVVTEATVVDGPRP
jgi:hypothetical protein